MLLEGATVVFMVVNDPEILRHAPEHPADHGGYQARFHQARANPSTENDGCTVVLSTIGGGQTTARAALRDQFRSRLTRMQFAMNQLLLPASRRNEASKGRGQQPPNGVSKTLTSNFNLTMQHNF